jgi:hypothetical protein
VTVTSDGPVAGVVPAVVSSRTSLTGDAALVAPFFTARFAVARPAGFAPAWLSGAAGAAGASATTGAAFLPGAAFVVEADLFDGAAAFLTCACGAAAYADAALLTAFFAAALFAFAGFAFGPSPLLVSAEAALRPAVAAAFLAGPALASNSPLAADAAA